MTARFGAIARDASGAARQDASFVWSSSAPYVATVTDDGVVSALTPGSSSITASFAGKSASAVVTVLASRTLALLQGVRLPVGATIQIPADVSGKTPIWAVNGIVDGNAAVGTVTKDGKYTAPLLVPEMNPVRVTLSFVGWHGVAGLATITIF